MQTYSVTVTKTAELELDEYFDFIALDSIPNVVEVLHVKHLRMNR